MIQTLTLENFRNYETAHLTFDPAVNLIVGENAQGKTNLLEAAAERSILRYAAPSMVIIKVLHLHV